MSPWYLISLVCVFLSGYWAYSSFKLDLQFAGWANVAASALNMAIFMKELI